jgi:hypothetical protein
MQFPMTKPALSVAHRCTSTFPRIGGYERAHAAVPQRRYGIPRNYTALTQPPPLVLGRIKNHEPGGCSFRMATDHGEPAGC